MTHGCHATLETLKSEYCPLRPPETISLLIVHEDNEDKWAVSDLAGFYSQLQSLWASCSVIRNSYCPQKR
jgi:hypothetical protein